MGGVGLVNVGEVYVDVESLIVRGNFVVLGCLRNWSFYLSYFRDFDEKDGKCSGLKVFDFLIVVFSFRVVVFFRVITRFLKGLCVRRFNFLRVGFCLFIIFLEIFII